MIKYKTSVGSLCLLLSVCSFQSCMDDEEIDYPYQPTALVTVRPNADSSFYLQLDDATTLHPTNLKTSPYGSKEVRALVNYTDESGGHGDARSVRINWMDSIRTKEPVQDAGLKNDSLYGNDPIEIVRDWVTIAEDGYLTLRIRTLWGRTGTTHRLNLLTGGDTSNPYELELRHDAVGDVHGEAGDALIAFNLNKLPHEGKGPQKIKISWMSFSGKKSAEFTLLMHTVNVEDEAEDILYTNFVY